MAGNQGVNRLARVLHKKMKETNKNADQAELATIQADLSLKTDHFPIAIPVREYFVSGRLAGQLKAGQRVLVIWVNQETDVIVIDTVTR